MKVRWVCCHAWIRRVIIIEGERAGLTKCQCRCGHSWVEIPMRPNEPSNTPNEGLRLGGWL